MKYIVFLTVMVSLISCMASLKTFYPTGLQYGENVNKMLNSRYLICGEEPLLGQKGNRIYRMSFDDDAYMARIEVKKDDVCSLYVRSHCGLSRQVVIDIKDISNCQKVLGYSVLDEMVSVQQYRIDTFVSAITTGSYSEIYVDLEKVDEQGTFSYVFSDEEKDIEIFQNVRSKIKEYLAEKIEEINQTRENRQDNRIEKEQPVHRPSAGSVSVR